MNLPDPPLFLVTDRRQALRPLADVLAAALTAGCRWLSVREKDLSEHEQLELATSLLPLARRFGARLLLHGDPALAARGRLDGVHLAAGGDPAAARALLGPQALIGMSVHLGDEAKGLDGAALDYVVAGPACETASKPGYGPVLGVSGLAAVVGASPVPVIAIGGIAAHNVAALMATGIAGIAVMGGVMRAEDPAREINDLLQAMGRGRLRRG